MVDLASDGSDLPVVPLPDFSWAEGDVTESLSRLFQWVESEALKAHDWYMQEKEAKSRISKNLRVIAVFCITVGAIFPTLSLISDGVVRSEWGYVAFGLGAGALLLDRAFGYSASWTRYMATAASIAGCVSKYQMAWTEWNVDNAQSASVDVSRVVHEVISPFAREIRDLIASETGTWASDLSDNISHLHNSLPRSTN